MANRKRCNRILGKRMVGRAAGWSHFEGLYSNAYSIGSSRVARLTTSNVYHLFNAEQPCLSLETVSSWSLLVVWFTLQSVYTVVWYVRFDGR